MKGYGIKTQGQAGWLEKEKPVAGPLDAVLRPVALAPCTSDVHVLHGGIPGVENLIVGHEAIGEVVEVGALVKHFKPGDIAVVPAVTPDWMSAGVQGKYSSHDNGPQAGLKFIRQKDGVFAEFFHVNQADANLALLPEGVSYEAALMATDMMTTGFHGVEQAEVEFGDSVVVMGIGPVGLMAVRAAHLRGAARIFAVGTRPVCVQVAREYGATDIVSYKAGDIVKQIIEANGGEVDRVIIAGGDVKTYRQSLELIKCGGIVANLNFWDPKDDLCMSAASWEFGMGNKDIRGGFCVGGAVRMRRLLALIKHGKVDAEKMVTHRFHGFDKCEEAFTLMGSKTPDLIKPVILL